MSNLNQEDKSQLLWLETTIERLEAASRTIPAKIWEEYKLLTNKRDGEHGQ